MSLQVIKELEEDCRFGLWEIEEDYQTLFDDVQLVEADITRLNSFKNDRRKLESLSVRALLARMTYKGARIIYDDHRKPYLLDGSYNISITHSNNYTAILLSKARRIGIDLEYMTHDMDRVADHFLRPEEYITPDSKMHKIHQYIHWCAKEALYKICDKKDIIFNRNLSIQRFEPAMKGSIVGIHRFNDGEEEKFDLKYWIDGNYVIVYCVK